MSKHTPGPWVVGRNNLPPEVMERLKKRSPLLEEYVNKRVEAEWEAREAKLEALLTAAPELLEALEAVLPVAEAWANEALGGGEDSSKFEQELDAFEKARAAIKKAKGEA